MPDLKRIPTNPFKIRKYRDSENVWLVDRDIEVSLPPIRTDVNAHYQFWLREGAMLSFHAQGVDVIGDGSRVVSTDQAGLLNVVCTAQGYDVDFEYETIEAAEAVETTEE